MTRSGSGWTEFEPWTMSDEERMEGAYRIDVDDPDDGYEYVEGDNDYDPSARELDHEPLDTVTGDVDLETLLVLARRA